MRAARGRLGARQEPSLAQPILCLELRQETPARHLKVVAHPLTRPFGVALSNRGRNVIVFLNGIPAFAPAFQCLQTPGQHRLAQAGDEVVEETEVIAVPGRLTNRAVKGEVGADPTRNRGAADFVALVIGGGGALDLLAGFGRCTGGGDGGGLDLKPHAQL